MIRVRLVADDVDQARAAAAAVARSLTVTRTSRPVPRRSGCGVSLYQDAHLAGDTSPGWVRVETGRMADDEGHLRDETRQWIQDQADRHYGGDWGRAAAALLEAAYDAAHLPGDPWAGLDSQLRHRPGEASDPGPNP